MTISVKHGLRNLSLFIFTYELSEMLVEYVVILANFSFFVIFNLQ